MIEQERVNNKECLSCYLVVETAHLVVYTAIECIQILYSSLKRLLIVQEQESNKASRPIYPVDCQRAFTIDGVLVR